MRTIVFDGVEIPEALLAAEVQNHPSASAAEARAAAGHALAIHALLLNRAREFGLHAAPEIDEAGREETPDEALVRAVLDTEVEFDAPSAAECRRVYDAHPERFRAPPLYEAAHILFEARANDADVVRAAHARAVEAIEAIEARTRRFADLAQELSDCPSGATGGSLGQLRPGDLVPEVEDVLVALQPGEVAPEPVLSRFGWHVVKLERRIEGRQLPFEAAEPRIRIHLESRAWTAAATRFVSELAAEARARGVALTLTETGAVERGSASLGDLLAGGAAAAARLEAWLATADPALAARVQAAAATAREPVSDFVQAAFAAFVAEANDERWTSLISAARDADDPALACLASVLRSKLVPARQTFTVIRRSRA